uniref:Glutaredoxin-2, mitochondrial n=1 Tax=Laticauda laticaudata TaxID=8630 RepID=A0A8C5RMN6_LATLA
MALRPLQRFWVLRLVECGMCAKRRGLIPGAWLAEMLMGNNASAATAISNTAITNQIKDAISDNCVVIFSKSTCSYCKMAKKLFQEMNVNYKAVELDRYENGNQFQDILHQMTGSRTVPRVFINGNFVGGATDTQQLHREGKLLPLVHQCQIQRERNSVHSYGFP